MAIPLNTCRIYYSFIFLQNVLLKDLIVEKKCAYNHMQTITQADFMDCVFYTNRYVNVYPNNCPVTHSSCCFLTLQGSIFRILIKQFLLLSSSFMQVLNLKQRHFKYKLLKKCKYCVCIGFRVHYLHVHSLAPYVNCPDAGCVVQSTEIITSCEVNFL